MMVEVLGCAEDMDSSYEDGEDQLEWAAVHRR